MGEPQINYKLWEAIKKVGLNQQKVALMAKMPAARLSLVMNGYYNLKTADKKTLAKILDKKVEDLF